MRKLQKTKKKKELLLDIVLLIVVIFLILVLGETIIRVINIGKPIEEDKPWVKHNEYSPFLVFGPNTNRKFLQNNNTYAYWNSQGFRLQYNLPFKKKKNEYRIFALGGSTTENLENKENLHYCGEMNKIFNQDKIPNVDVFCINAGMSGYSTAHTLIRLQFDLLQFKPNMITVMHNINDLSVNFFPSIEGVTNYGTKYFNNYYFPKLTYRNYIGKSRFFSFLYKYFTNVKNKIFANKITLESGEYILSTMRFNNKPTELRYKDDFRNNLISIVRIAKAHNITVVLMSQPAIFSPEKIALSFGHKPYNKDILYPKREEFIKLFEECNAVVSEVAEQEQVHLIDMYDLLGHNEKDFRDMNHLTPEGIKKFANIYAEHLRDIIEGETQNAKK